MIRKEDLFYDLIAFLVSILAAFACWKFSQNEAMSILIGISLQMAFWIFSLRQKQNTLLDKMGHALGLSVLLPIIERTEKISRSGTHWERFFLDRAVKRFSSGVTDITNNTLALTPSEFMEFAEVFFGSLTGKDELFATSLFGGGEYWRKNYGQRYAALNTLAAAAGAKITRVFIPRDEQQFQSLQSIGKEQSNYAKVMYTPYSTIKDVDQLATRDFFLLNNDVACEFRFTPDFQEVETILVTLDSQRLQTYARIKRLVLSSAAPLPVG